MLFDSTISPSDTCGNFRSYIDGDDNDDATRVYDGNGTGNIGIGAVAVATADVVGSFGLAAGFDLVENVAQPDVVATEVTVFVVVLTANDGDDVVVILDDVNTGA
jgi:hypothetical protein